MPHVQPSFLELPVRSIKPRRTGVTHVIDKGYTLSGMEDALLTLGEIIDVWKFAWGTSYIDPSVRSKVAALNRAGVKTCTGGTLLELSWLQQQTDEFFQFAKDTGFSSVEVSNGSVGMSRSEKRKLISQAHDLGFEVMAEVGRKDVRHVMPPSSWCEEASGDLAAGADWIIAEGRESGAAGLYDQWGNFDTTYWKH